MSKRTDLYDLDELFGLPDLFGDVDRLRRTIVASVPDVFRRRSIPDLPAPDFRISSARHTTHLPAALPERPTAMAPRQPLPEEREVHSLAEPVAVADDGRKQKPGPSAWTGLLSLFGLADTRAEEADEAITAARQAAASVGALQDDQDRA